MDDEEAVDAVVDERGENRVMGSKKRKIGDKIELVDSKPSSGGCVSSTHLAIQGSGQRKAPNAPEKSLS